MGTQTPWVVEDMENGEMGWLNDGMGARVVQRALQLLHIWRFEE